MVHFDENSHDVPLLRASLWRSRDFLFLWSGQAISTLGTSMSTLALPLLVLAVTHSSVQAGLIAAAQSAPYFILSLPAGVMIDRWNRKIIMILCDIARWLAYGSVPLAYVLGKLTVIQLYGVAIISGTAFVFFNIAQISSLSRVVVKDHLPRANALNQASDSAATLIGPALSGFIINIAGTIVAGATLAYLFDSISYVVSVISLCFIRTSFQIQREASAKRSLWVEIGQGLHFIWTEPRLRILAFIVASTGFLSSPADLATIVLAQQQLHADAGLIGLILSISSFGGLIGSFIAPSVKAHLRFGQIIIGAIAVEALGCVILAAAIAPIMLIIGLASIAIAIPVISVTQVSYRLSLIPDKLQGRVNSVFRLLFFGGQPVGIALGGLLMGPLGPRFEYWLIAIGLAVTAFIVSFTAIRKD